MNKECMCMHTCIIIHSSDTCSSEAEACIGIYVDENALSMGEKCPDASKVFNTSLEMSSYRHKKGAIPIYTHLQGGNLICVSQSWWWITKIVVGEVQSCKHSKLKHIQWQLRKLVSSKKSAGENYMLIHTVQYVSKKCFQYQYRPADTNRTVIAFRFIPFLRSRGRS